MGTVYPQTTDAINAADAFDMDQVIVLSYETSAWRAEHFFSVTKEVPGQEMVRITGDFITKVFEGPYKNAPIWEKELKAFVKNRGKQIKKTYFFYTTCPKCAKYYGKNYVVGVAEV
jgi:hypothetical protein